MAKTATKVTVEIDHPLTRFTAEIIRNRAIRVRGVRKMVQEFTGHYRLEPVTPGDGWATDKEVDYAFQGQFLEAIKEVDAATRDLIAIMLGDFCAGFETYHPRHVPYFAIRDACEEFLGISLPATIDGDESLDTQGIFKKFRSVHSSREFLDRWGRIDDTFRVGQKLTTLVIESIGPKVVHLEPGEGRPRLRVDLAQFVLHVYPCEASALRPDGTICPITKLPAQD